MTPPPLGPASDDALAAAGPITSFAAWYAEGEATEPDVPDAMQVATVGPDGRPSVRTVLLKAFDADGFVFFTNTHSRKGRQLAAHPWAAAVVHHKGLQRQLHVEGRVESVSDAEADAYFATRPRGSQVGAWASQQSQPVADRASLIAAVEAADARFAGVDVPRPPHWSGFRIVPDRVELWQGRPDRLHDRHCWTREADGAWRYQRLQP